METLTKAVDYGMYGEFHLRKLINGDLQIAISEGTRSQLAAYAGESEYEWPNLEEYFEGTFEYLRGNSSFEFMDGQYQMVIACWGGPVVIQRVYFPSDDPRYNGSDDELGTDWDQTDVWAYENYALRLEIEDLIEFGEVIYKYVKD